MKEIENIFTNSKIKKEQPCPNPLTPITIDTREKNSLIAANLIERKALTKFEKLEIGDYLIKDICIERKTFSDFISSMINKRLQEQLIQLKKYENHILILEGFDYRYEKFKIHENAIRGMITSIVLNFKVPIVYTKDSIDTSKFLINIARKQEKEKSSFSIRESKTKQTVQEQKQFILEGFPEIGPTTAKKLLENKTTLKEIFELQKEELSKIGLNENQVNSFHSIIND